MNERIPANRFRAELAGKTGRKGRAKGQNKYGAQKTERHGITFDSKREADRYDELRLLERAGEITELKRQVRIDLLGANGGPLASDTGRTLHYLADFAYRDANGLLIVEDAKGTSPKEYKLKKAVLRAQGVEIVEV